MVLVRGWIFCPPPALTQNKNKLSHNCLFQDPCHFVSCVLLVSSLVACLFCMPPQKGLSQLEATKAYQIEQQRVRTERRLAQLRQEQRQLERSEVLDLFGLIWLVLIVLLYARLYLGPQK